MDTMKNNKEELLPLGKQVTVDWTVEELERRLEMSVLQLPQSEWCIFNCSDKVGCCNAGGCRQLVVE
jgi:hypothetical protein